MTLLRLFTIAVHPDFDTGTYIYLQGCAHRYRTTVSCAAAASGFASRGCGFRDDEIEMDFSDLEQEPQDGAARFEATGLAGWDKCPIRELVEALREEAKVPLYWVVRWSGGGRDQVANAWDKATDKRGMLRLLSTVRNLNPRWGVAHRQACRWWITADTIRADVPIPPTLEECLDAWRDAQNT